MVWIVALCFALGVAIFVTGRTARKDYHENRPKLIMRDDFPVKWYDFASNEYYDIGVLFGQLVSGIIATAAETDGISLSVFLAIFQAIRWATVSRITYGKKNEPPSRSTSIQSEAPRSEGSEGDNTGPFLMEYLIYFSARKHACLQVALST